MFGKLKEKLKGWISRTKEETKENEPVEAVPKKEKVVKPKKGDKPQKKVFKKEKEVGKVDKKKVEEKIPEKPVEIVAPPAEIEETKEASKESSGTDVVSQEAVVSEEPITDEKPVAGVDSSVKKSFFSRFRRTLSDDKFDEVFDDLELILLQNNVAFGAVEAIRSSLREKLVGESASSDIAVSLRDSISGLLVNPPDFLGEIKSSLSDNSPFVVLFAGINGSGKTTTIAKVAKYLQGNGLSVCLAAADTFRAAAIQQLEEHARRLGVPVVKKDYGSDPAAVGFDAITYARKHKVDVVLIDTAGRLQNKDSLMREIEKIVRVTKPHMKIFLGESITGNDATEQARVFNDAIGLTGIILSKADVDEKGGTAISVSHVTGKPILFLGTGQEYGDLEVFDKEKLIEKLGLV